MRGHDFEKNKVVPLIFKQFYSRSHLNKLDRLTPKDIYYLPKYVFIKVDYFSFLLPSITGFIFRWLQSIKLKSICLALCRRSGPLSHIDHVQLQNRSLTLQYWLKEPS